jgi:hypothetical protein
MKCYIAIFTLVSFFSEAKPFKQEIKELDVSFTMIPVKNGDETFWISRTEITWDLYDSFLQFINSPENLHAGVDAVTGPTPAYALVDRGYGRSGYPAISMSAKAAESFVSWLSTKTGKKYSIPTLKQWNAANVEGGTSWHKKNADKKTHLVATSEPNELGIYDMNGNVGEWVTTKDGARVIGGSFRTSPEELGTKTLLTPISDWNKTDPQLPRSPWWLADADFVGLRIVTNDGEKDE